MINNDFDFNNNNYTKIFLNKLHFLKIVNITESRSNFYLAYLKLINKRIGKIVPFIIFYFLRFKLLISQLIEFTINKHYRINVFKKIMIYFGK